MYPQLPVFGQFYILYVNPISVMELILRRGINVSRASNSAERRATVRDNVPALTKTIAIIRYLNAAPSTGASLHDVADRLQITKSHCFNILN